VSGFGSQTIRSYRGCIRRGQSPKHTSPNPMARLIKNQLARLITLTAAFCWFNLNYKRINGTNILADQCAAAIMGVFHPKIFWDFSTSGMDRAVRPVPALQILNFLASLSVAALEWPLGRVAGSALHRSVVFRLVALPTVALPAALMYQSFEAAFYYMIGLAMYGWAYYENEVWPSALVQTSC
jgi:hypothetical protein